MLDLLYILGTAIFFAAMLGYVRACQWVGRDETREGQR